MIAAPPAVGVVLVSLGTPDEPTLPAVRRFLRQFLSDRRVVDLNPVLWRPILELSVLRGHAQQSTAKYASVWRPDGSPLLVHARHQAQALTEALGGRLLPPPDDPGADVTRSAAGGGAEAGGRVGTADLAQATASADLAQASRGDGAVSDGAGLGAGAVVVTYAMRYGRPALDQALDQLRAAGVRRWLVVPMYPQFSTTTTATVFDALAAYLADAQDHPELRWIRSWATDPGYIEACAHQIERFWDQHGYPTFAAGDKFILSYHGIPAKLVAAGDPYEAECRATTDALRQRLRLGPEHLLMTYQSKFGKGEWLTPATIDTVAKLGQLDTKRLDVFCPGFAVDCLETLEEIDLLNRDEFARQGGADFHRVPCLNDAPLWIEALAALVRSHIVGWDEDSRRPAVEAAEPV
ncbi:MAG: ferrochelatase [Propionibacteriaceae bacterium]|nr:ferrochelatase [Propionibacteriaceae bacterium]